MSYNKYYDEEEQADPIELPIKSKNKEGIKYTSSEK